MGFGRPGGLRHISQHQALRAATVGSAALDLKRENPALANPSGPRRHQKETAAPWAEGTAADGVRAQEKTQREEYAEALIEASGLERVTNWNRARWDWKAAIMKDHRLSDGAKLVAVVLCDTFANSKTALCYPGVKTLAETLGKSERSIRRALAELREAGWIVTEAGRRPHDRQGFIFTKGDGTVLMDEKVADLCAHRAAKAASEAEGGRTDMTGRAVKFVRPYNKEGTKELNQYPPTPQERRRRTNPTDCASGHATAELGEAPGTASDAPGGYRPVAEKTGPARTGGARSSAPPPPPVPWQRVVPAGSAAEAEWNDWLKARDLPTLAELGRRASEADAVGWAAPWKFPPPERDAARCEQAEKWAWWAVARMNDQARAAGPAHAF